jgi:hypothetical protein
MAGIARELGGMPLIVRCTVIGSATFGFVGAIGGLVLGLAEYPATAWFAVFEGGFLAALAGGLLGFLAGAVAYPLAAAAHRIRRRR